MDGISYDNSSWKQTRPIDRDRLMPNDKMVEQELLLILEEAIKEEIASAARYRRGEKLATHPEMKSMFKKLAEEEVMHEQALKERYYAIKKKLGLKLMHDQ